MTTRAWRRDDRHPWWRDVAPLEPVRAPWRERASRGQLADRRDGAVDGPQPRPAPAAGQGRAAAARGGAPRIPGPLAHRGLLDKPDRGHVRDAGGHFPAAT